MNGSLQVQPKFCIVPDVMAQEIASPEIISLHTDKLRKCEMHYMQFYTVTIKKKSFYTLLPYFHCTFTELSTTHAKLYHANVPPHFYRTSTAVYRILGVVVNIKSNGREISS